jgi:hypothetical protein
MGIVHFELIRRLLFTQRAFLDVQVTARVPLAREHFIACADKPAPYIQCAPLAAGRTTIVATASPPPAMSVLFIEISWQGLLREYARRGVVG